MRDPARHAITDRAKRLREYGINEEIFRALELSQQGECAICGKPETKMNPAGNVRKLSVDHGHGDGLVRGLLCLNCNTGLGHFGDSPVWLRQAALYLEANGG